MVTRSQLQTPQTGNRFSRFVKNSIEKFNTRRERRAESILAVTSPQTIASRPRSERREVASALRFLGRRNPGAVRNWYEGGFPFLDGTRAWTPSIIQDARYDQNMVTRRELLRRMRYWSQNSGLCKSTLDNGRQYVIGTHMPVVTSLSSDSSWGERAEKVFEEMVKTAGIDDESFFQMLTVAYDCKKIDGDILFVQTSVRKKIPIRQGTKYETAIEKSVPRFQMVEGHRIETPPSLWQREGQDIVDGVQFKIVEQSFPGGEKRKAMVRVGYWVKDSISQFAAAGFMQDDAYVLIPVEHCTLVYSPTRVNQIRGLSDFYAGETTLALLEDLQKMEMRAQEIQSDLTVFITNGAGQMVNEKTQGTLSALNIKLSTDQGGKPIVTASDIEKTKQVYENIYGGKQYVGRTGDTLSFLAPNRPSEATQNLWEYLINIWCASAKGARILIFPKAAKGQGTEVRAELDKFNTSCIGEFNQNWKPLIQSSWNYFIGWAKDNDSRLANAPEDWNRIEVSPPRSVMVDLGYDSASMLAELSAGVTNLHFVAQRLGTTAKRLIAMAVQDIYNLKKACLQISGSYKEGQVIEVKPEEVRQSLGDVVKNLAAMKTAEAQKQAAENQTAGVSGD